MFAENAANGKYSHIHWHMCWWDYTEWITRSFINKAKEGGYVRIIHEYPIVLFWQEIMKHSVVTVLKKAMKTVIVVTKKTVMMTNVVLVDCLMVQDVH